MKKALAFAIVLPLTAALTAGTPVPRAIVVSQDACSALCSDTDQTPLCPSAGEPAAACSPRDCGPVAACPPATADCSSCEDAGPAPAGGEITCDFCICCQCGIGLTAGAVPVQPPFDDDATFRATGGPLESLEHRPASPPPKTSA